MADVRISPVARADMVEIADYISLKLQNQSAARRLVQQFRKEIGKLSDFPEMGTPLFASGRLPVLYRYVVCGNYMIFYHISEAAVLVDRVLYGRRDYLALLFADLLEEDE